MPSVLSPRLRAIVDALPLAEGLRVLEIGCGTGALARAMARRVGRGHVLAIDRSARALDLARRSSADVIATGRLSFRKASAETFALRPDETPFDLVVAVRVGALDGRYPGLECPALHALAAACRPGACLYTDGGAPLIVRALPPLP